MSSFDEKNCPICRTHELTPATKVYPLCECELCLCFDCLRKYVKMRYSCPFCNIPFSQNTFRQSAEELRLRLRGRVASDSLEEVVNTWVTQLRDICSEMAVGLAVLSVDADKQACWPLQSLKPYLYSSSHLFNVIPSIFSNPTAKNMTSFVQPLPIQKSNSIRADLLNIGHCSTAPGVASRKTSQVSPTVDKFGPRKSESTKRTSITWDEDFFDEVVTPSLSDEEGVYQAESPKSWSSTGVSAEVFYDFVQYSGSSLDAILAKRLYVRELVDILPGSNLAKKLAPNSVGVVMKYTGELLAQKNGDLRWVKDCPISLTVRLLDGSWLTNVAVEDVDTRGDRATLRQYLRVGDLLLTRFGIALACDLHPTSGQVTIKYPKGLKNIEVHHNIGKVDQIYQSVRTVCGFSAVAFDANTFDNQTPRSEISKNEMRNISTFKPEGESTLSLEFENNFVLRADMKSGEDYDQKSEHADFEDRVSQRYSEQKFDKFTGHPSSQRPGRLHGKLCDFDAFEKNEFLSIDDIFEWSPGDEALEKKNGTLLSELNSNQDMFGFNSTDRIGTKKIYEGDIKTVFSAREIFDVIEQKVEDERHICQPKISKPNGRRSLKRCTSITLDTFDEKALSHENGFYRVKPL